MDSIECHHCGVPGLVGETCIKCGAKLRQNFSGPLFVIDVAHSGEDREEASRKVIWGIETALHGAHRGLKVIHGRSGIIKTHVVRLLRHEAGRLGARLAGERNNPGAHILYFE